jgi:hypothetical protein
MQDAFEHTKKVDFSQILMRDIGTYEELLRYFVFGEDST